MAVRRNLPVLQLAVASLVLCTAGCVHCTQLGAAAAHRGLRQKAPDPVYPPATTPEAQKKVLLASKDQFAGNKADGLWELSSWTKEEPLSYFWGIKVDDAGLVTSIEFGSGTDDKVDNWETFTGQLPPSWASLTSLKSISIVARSVLQGSLPPSWAALTNLDNLEVYPVGNLTGRLPASWGRKMKKFKYIKLKGHKLSGPLPASWSGMTALSQLDLSENKLTGQLPGSWGSFSKLTVLHLGNNKLRGPLPAAWANLSKSLVVLDVHNNVLLAPVPKWLGNFTKLSQLELAQNKFFGDLPTAIFTKTQLAVFSAHDNPNLGGCIPKAMMNRKDAQGRPFRMSLYDFDADYDDFMTYTYQLNSYALVKGEGPLWKSRITGYCAK